MHAMSGEISTTILLKFIYKCYFQYCAKQSNIIRKSLARWELIEFNHRGKTQLNKQASKTLSDAERVFGKLDNLLRTKPKISTLTAEACIMFLNNKRMDWLKTKSDEEKPDLIPKALKSVSRIRQVLRKNTSTTRNTLQEQSRKREAAKQVRLKQQETYTTGT